MARSTALHRGAGHHKAIELRKGAVVPIRGSLRDIKPDTSPELNLERFHELEFKAFNNRDWELYRKICAPDVIITYPDGRRIVGVEESIKDLKDMFSAFPDFKIIEHPVRIGSGEWTAVTETVTATFSQPMLNPDGSSIPPTGKSVKMESCTVARWKDGRLVEEQLFWDSREWMKQIGLAK
ncbi:MAG: ester cyclase [Deltaproteobacteria bacterium]|nr:ester cyclase [Deltaproteobacteria bacterium]